jgi:hypothetical protein
MKFRDGLMAEDLPDGAKLVKGDLVRRMANRLTTCHTRCFPTTMRGNRLALGPLMADALQ